MYDIEKFRYKYVGICAGIKVVAAAIFLIDWFLIRQCYERNKAFTLTVGDVMASVASLDKVPPDNENSPFPANPPDELMASSQPPTPSIVQKRTRIPLTTMSTSIGASGSKTNSRTSVSYESSI